MNAYASHGGVDKRRFEMYALAASIIGKCHFCVKSHFDTLVAGRHEHDAVARRGPDCRGDQCGRAVYCR